MATNAATLISFGGELSVGDWIYSVIPRSAPAYLPLTNNSVSYLQSSYPVLTSVLASNNKFTYVVAQSPISLGWSVTNWFRQGTAGNGMFVTSPYSEPTNRYLLYGANTGSSPGWNFYVPAWRNAMEPRDFGYGNNVFAVVGTDLAQSNGTVMYHATKATILASGAWTSKTLPDTLEWTGIAYDSNTHVWVAISPGLANTARSTDGLATWTRGGQATGGNSLKPIAAGNSTFVTLPYGGASNGQYSINGGTTWANSTGFPSGLTWQSIAYGNGVFVAVSSYTVSPTAVSSTNGITFTSLAVPDLGYVGARGLQQVAYGNGVWCIVSSVGSNTSSANLTHAFSSDLITWTTVSIPNSVSTDSSPSYAVGYSGANNEWFNISKSVSGTRFVATSNTTSFKLPLVTSQWGAIPYIKAT